MKMKYMNFFKGKTMKASGLMLILAIMIPSLRMVAQNPDRERLDAYKIAFFTRRMNLTSQEAEKFWPVYNEFTSQRNQLQLEKQSIMRTFNQSEGTLSEKEINELSNRYLEILVRESAVAVDVHKKVMELLPPGKVIRMYQAENQYRLQLLNELQQRRPQQPGNNRMPGNNRQPFQE